MKEAELEPHPARELKLQQMGVITRSGIRGRFWFEDNHTYNVFQNRCLCETAVNEIPFYKQNVTGFKKCPPVHGCI